MTLTEIGKLPLGIYKVFWKSGGCSVASLGMCSNGDTWIAPANWTTPAVEDAYKIWRNIKKMELILNVKGELP